MAPEFGVARLYSGVSVAHPAANFCRTALRNPFPHFFLQEIPLLMTRNTASCCKNTRFLLPEVLLLIARNALSSSKKYPFLRQETPFLATRNANFYPLTRRYESE
jgi:hypothetical protein